MTDNICPEPGCGLELEPHWTGPGNYWRCPRNADAHARWANRKEVVNE